MQRDATGNFILITLNARARNKTEFFRVKYETNFYLLLKECRYLITVPLLIALSNCEMYGYQYVNYTATRSDVVIRFPADFLRTSLTHSIRENPMRVGFILHSFK